MDFQLPRRFNSMRKMTLAGMLAVLVTTAACTFAPAATQDPVTLHRETAVRQFTAALKELAGPLALVLLTDEYGSIDYSAMEKAGTIRVIYDADGLPSLFAVTSGRFALRQDIPQYLVDGTRIINEYDKAFLAHIREIRIAAIYYGPGIFDLVPSGGASNQFLSAGRDANRYYRDYSPSYYGAIIINREFIFDGSLGFGDRNDLFAVAVILHEVGRMEGKRNASIINTDEYTYQYAIGWLSKSGIPSTLSEYRMLKNAFDAERVTK
jgi:hypothetical protein